MPRRREDRVLIALPVRIWGMDANGKPFSQNAQTVDITKLGARLGGVKAGLLAGEIIGVQHEQEKSRFRILWVGAAGTPFASQIGLHCVEPEKYIWGVSLAQLRMTSAAASRILGPSARPAVHAAPAPIAAEPPAPALLEKKGRRQDTRFACTGSVEIRQEGIGPPLWATLSDISINGCYAETLAPLPAKTKLRIKVNSRGYEFMAVGEVRTCHPQVGMGINFTQLSVEDRDRLDQLVSELSGEPRAAAAPPPPVMDATTSAIVATLNEAGIKLREVEDAVNTGNPDVDSRLMSEFRSALDHARKVVTAIHNWVELQSQQRDPFAILTALDRERVRITAQLCRNIALDIDGSSINMGTEGIEDLHLAAKQLYSRLNQLMESKRTGRVAGN